MKDGLYQVTFNTRMGGGAGVVTLRDGKIGGGDSAIWYAGTFTETKNKFTAEVLTGRHSTGLPSVFGVDKLQINLTGTTDGDTAKLSGTSPQAPGVQLDGTLTRITD